MSNYAVLFLAMVASSDKHGDYYSVDVWFFAVKSSNLKTVRSFKTTLEIHVFY